MTRRRCWVKHLKRRNIGGRLSAIYEHCAHTKRGHVEKVANHFNIQHYISEEPFAVIFIYLCSQVKLVCSSVKNYLQVQDETQRQG